MIKKFLTLAVCFLLVFACCSCSDKNNSETKPNNNLPDIFGESLQSQDGTKPNKEISIEKMYNPAPSDAQDGKCGENATWRIENGTLFVEGDGAMWDYSLESTAPWSAISNEIDHITVGDGITIIGDYAFSYLDKVGSVEIGNKVSYIGNSSFYGLDELDEVYIPSNVKVIGDFAFKFCSNLEEVTFNDGLLEIGEGAFSLCYDLERVMLPNSVTTVKRDVFNGCSGLESVSLPMFLDKIGVWCFADSGLETVTIPKSLTYIPTGVFDGCNELEAVYYGGSEQDWASVRIENNNAPLDNVSVYFNAR